MIGAVPSPVQFSPKNINITIKLFYIKQIPALRKDLIGVSRNKRRTIALLYFNRVEYRADLEQP